MDSWPQGSFLALDVVAILLITLSYFLYRARNWARLILMGGCIGYNILAVVGGVALGAFDANIVDDVYITGILIWSIAGPLLLIFILRQPEVVKEFGASVPNRLATNIAAPP
jgi:MFS-type transporter involved in bile tolerance (Atg22 family)